MDWWIGLLGSATISGIAYWKKSLTAGGGLAAVIVGTIVFALGSPAWYGSLIAFFISSTLWARWRQEEKRGAEQRYAKTANRDAGQVFANGGAALLACMLHSWIPHPAVWMFFLGSLAAVNADTWATELGSLSRGEPRLILGGRKVARGTSGAVSWAGIAASASGGLFIALVALALGGHTLGSPAKAASSSSTASVSISLLIIGTAAGLFGSLTDSLIGASCQVLYRCPSCGLNVESAAHCGVRGQRVRGLPWMNNDAANFLCSIVGGTIASSIYLMQQYLF